VIASAAFISSIDSQPPAADLCRATPAATPNVSRRLIVAAAAESFCRFAAYFMAYFIFCDMVFAEMPATPVFFRRPAISPRFDISHAAAASICLSSFSPMSLLRVQRFSRSRRLQFEMPPSPRHAALLPPPPLRLAAPSLRRRITRFSRQPRRSRFAAR